MAEQAPNKTYSFNDIVQTLSAIKNENNQYIARLGILGMTAARRAGRYITSSSLQAGLWDEFKGRLSPETDAAAIEMIDAIQDASRNPDTQEKLDLVNNAQLAVIALHTQVTSLAPMTHLVLIRKVNEITDAKLQLQILRQISRNNALMSEFEHKDRTALRDMIANNKYATTLDMYNVIEYYIASEKHNHELMRTTVQNLFSDMLNRAKNEFSAEIQSQNPNPEEMEYIGKYLQYANQSMEASGITSSDDAHKIKQHISEQFDVHNALIGGIEYMKQFEETTFQQNKMLSSELVRAKDALRELQEKYDALHRMSEQFQAEHAKTVQNLNATTAALQESRNSEASLRKTISMKDSHLKLQEKFITDITEKAATVNTGLMAGKGVKELKDMIQRGINSGNDGM